MSDQYSIDLDRGGKASQQPLGRMQMSVVTAFLNSGATDSPDCVATQANPFEASVSERRIQMHRGVSRNSGADGRISPSPGRRNTNSEVQQELHAQLAQDTGETERPFNDERDGGPY